MSAKLWSHAALRFKIFRRNRCGTVFGCKAGIDKRFIFCRTFDCAEQSIQLHGVIRIEAWRLHACATSDHLDLAAAGRDHILNPFLCARISRADRDQQWEITDALNSFERNYIPNCHSILRDRKRLCEISQHHFHHRFIARLKTEIDIIDPFFEVWIIGKNDSLDCFVDQLRTKRPQCDEDHPQAASRALMNQTCRHWSQLATACRIEVE